jgi:hypothetical protein
MFRRRISQRRILREPSQYPTINFTVEVEQKKNPFLDVCFQRQDHKFEFNIHRKPASTNRYINQSSFHPYQHKAAVFHAMAHRLTQIPMQPRNYHAERKNIFKIGTMNGYNETFVRSIIEKHERNKRQLECSTMFQHLNRRKYFQGKTPYLTIQNYQKTSVNRLNNKTFEW